MRKYDIAIIGSGVGGFASASVLIEANKKVVMIEADVWGGTCPNHGCDQKKYYSLLQKQLNKANNLKGKELLKYLPSIGTN